MLILELLAVPVVVTALAWLMETLAAAAGRPKATLASRGVSAQPARNASR